VERADLSVSLGMEGTSPVSGTPAAPGQSSPRDREGKPRRRPPLPEESVERPAEVEEVETEEKSDPPPHKIDSLA
jgi:hypothetical protein